MQTSFIGPPIEDPAILEMVPDEMSSAWRSRNGFISEDGGFHVRGACSVPLWHSLRVVWMGEYALHRLFQAVRASDIPLAQDCFGDQYLLREGCVVRLYGETGEIKELRMGWNEFLGHIDAGPLEFLELQHLHRFKREGGILLPGQLLFVYPPFVASYEGDRSMRAIPSLELISWLADFARQIADVPDGGRIRIKVLKESGNASKV
jgi:hypothetical protein